ncbi:MAG: VCBS repeat-containing protein [Cyclobacteriaceae bacterium]|nr:VCBS repeat-containing protein [Cyclobacteriaceae bacterium]
MKYTHSLIAITLCLFLNGCFKGVEKRFQVIEPAFSGIAFSNSITANDTFNVIDFYYIYNGGGIGIGDFNQDGLPDVYFGGNEVSNELYLNRGDFRFEEIAKEAGVEAADIWSQGIAVADINNDGWPDIYVCASIYGLPTQRVNKFFINNGLNHKGIPTFSEEAHGWGIADSGHSSNAAFFDYDLDGDLDLFIINNFMDRKFPSQFRPAIVDGSSVNSDKLYENKGNGHFEDVSVVAGILIEGYSHGISVRDINIDGWPDIYITNDFLPNDILYINNRNGTFSNKVSDYLKHQCFSAMGNDIADINNDGFQEIFALDMLPEINYRKKTMLLRSNPMNQLNYQLYDYDFQFIRNMLQLNMGPDGDGNMHFGDIGFMAGIYETDWSWAPVFADFDNDGFKDLVIANGFPGDVTDMDFANYMSKYQNFISKRSELFDTIPEVRIDNYIFKNNGNLTFTKKTSEWGFEAKTFSNGAAYADFDNDGDLDFVTNNIDGPATLYRNHSISDTKISEGSNFLKIKLKGNAQNEQGIGAKILLYTGREKQFLEYSPYRGFMSTMDAVVHFGIGKYEWVDSIVVFWPQGQVSSIFEITANQEMEISVEKAKMLNRSIKDQLFQRTATPVFTNSRTQIQPPFVHQERELFDFNLQRTLPHKLSQYTPGIAVCDYNSDGLEDFYIGGNGQFAGSFYIQNSIGDFHKEERITLGDSLSAQDMGVLFFDSDGDGDKDLYLVSGGMAKEPGDVGYIDRLYLNDGRGYFSYQKSALPDIRRSGSCVKAGDYDNDGDLDLFVGTATSPGQYPLSEPSYILRNDNGKFLDMTAVICPSLDSAKMVNDAIWTDFDNDNWLDLIVVGEWMDITFFKNDRGKFTDISKTALPMSTSGWWKCISGSDLDDDGDIDYICGNLGLNSLLVAIGRSPSLSMPRIMTTMGLSTRSSLNMSMTKDSI